MALYLLDSDAVIDFLTGMERTQALIRQRYANADVLCVDDIVIAEVFSGAHPNERADVAAFLASLNFLGTSIEIARQAGLWRYEYARRGIQLATSDAVNAATARFYAATILTANVSDYPMPEVSILQLPR